jgi:hypothetical protein
VLSTTRQGRFLRAALGTAVFLAWGLRPGDALAFKEAGHRSIEAAAYRDLLDTESGREVVRTLIRYGVLNPPAPPRAPPTELLDPEFADFSVDSLVVESHFPDHLFDRQLQSNLQCFHFNARGGHFKLDDHNLYGDRIPLGLSEDAYVECIGVADTLLRGVLFDPRGSHRRGSGMYTLMHMVEDSYADSHVARSTPDWARDSESDGSKPAAHSDESAWPIIYVKPWNLRTWPRYFVGNKHPEAIHSHFSEEHHMGSDTRDLGYLVGPTDENYGRYGTDPQYQRQVKACVKEAAALIRRHRRAEYQERPITIEDMQGEIVVPPVCLSQRGYRAKEAVRELLRLVAMLVPHVRKVNGADGKPLKGNEVKEVHTAATPLASEVSLEDLWRDYRFSYLRHYDDYLTEFMMTRPVGEFRTPEQPRKDLVYSSDAITPRSFHESGFGLTAELRIGTPLWVGVEEFMSRKTSSHNRPVLLLDALGWGIQVRLPIEDELGERPAGAALDAGFGLPLPISELFDLQELQIYLGVRGRLAYTVQSIFESETRHSLELGFGGVSADFVVGNLVWFGFDAPRRMYRIDFWSGAKAWEPWLWSFSAGAAVDAF